MTVILKHKDDKEKILEEIAKKHWQRTRAFLLSRYSLTEDECADVFQESLIILWNNIIDNKVETKELNVSSSAYFMTICRNKTMEMLRRKSKYISTPLDVNPNSDQFNYQGKQVERLLAMDESHEEAQKEKEALVREIIMNLPSPCNELLWGYYGDGYSLKALAEMFNYASENVVKVTKHRCCEKFRVRYLERSKSLT